MIEIKYFCQNSLLKFTRRFNVIKRLLYILITLTFFSCSVEKDTMTSKAYHNTLARYNGYFLAKEKMKEVEQTVAESSPDNFSRVLKVYPTVTSGTVSAINPDLEEVIKKASLPIQRHKNSKWVDNSYTLVGVSRYYRMDYDNASITFKYVNSKGEDENDKHEALTWLLRTFTQTEQYDNAFSVVSHLGKKDLTDKNKELFSLAKAELYQKIEEKNSFLKSMKESAEVVKNRNNKARVNFIMGQLNQELKNNEEAYKNYTVVIRKSPTYEMSFYAKLYRTQVTDLNKKDPKKVIKYYKKLLRDEKNEEYQDKIYYEMARFEYKQEKLPSSLDYLTQSLRANKGNINQKAYSYLMKAEIYYEDLRNYRQASIFYDSTFATLDKTEKKYPEVKKRAEVLKEFVKQWEIVHREDSLQKLAKMDTASLYAFLDSSILAEEKAIQEEIERKKEAEERKKNLAANNQTQNNLNILNNAMGGRGNATWYFYNPALLDKGKMAFTQKWGERELADNWRRESKKKLEIEEVDIEELEENSEGEKEQKSTDELQAARLKKKRDERLKQIPFSKKQLDESNERLKNALYELAGIYHLKLSETKYGSDTYERLAKEFSKFEKIDEVYYTLYIMNQEIQPDKSEYYKNLLLREYPNSVYAKLVLDPEYLIKNEQLNKRAQGKYAIAYDLHKNELYDSSYNACDKILVEFPETDIKDKIVFLKALNIGMQDTSVIIFKQLLEKFIADYQQSELIPLANEYLNGLNEYINKKIAPATTSSAMEFPKVKFALDMNEPHYFISIVEKGKVKKFKVENAFAQFNDQNWASEKYKTKTMLFKKTSFMVQITEFKDGKKALNYYNTINVSSDILEGMPVKGHDSFIISKSNFEKFYKGKYLKEYLSFFREKYIVNEGKSD